MIVNKSFFIMILVVFLFVFGTIIPAGAEDIGDIEAALPVKASQWEIDGGFQCRLDTDIDNGSSFSVTSGKLGIGMKKPIAEKLNLDVYSAYSLHTYDFSDVEFFGDDPWEDINEVLIRAMFSYQLDPQWIILGGGIFMSASEKNAREENNNGGGLVGFMYISNPDLIIGTAMVAISQTEDDALVVPIPLVQWRFADNWHLKTGVSNIAADFGLGLEVGCSLSEQIEVSAGAQVQNKRFRLDHKGLSPNGFGKDESVPVYLKATWRVKPNISVELVGSAYTGGELTLEDENGDKLWSEDYDPAFMTGLLVTCNF